MGLTEVYKRLIVLDATALKTCEGLENIICRYKCIDDPLNEGRSDTKSYIQNESTRNERVALKLHDTGYSIC